MSDLANSTKQYDKAPEPTIRPSTPKDWDRKSADLYTNGIVEINRESAEDTKPKAETKDTDEWESTWSKTTGSGVRKIFSSQGLKSVMKSPEITWPEGPQADRSTMTSKPVGRDRTPARRVSVFQSKRTQERASRVEIPDTVHNVLKKQYVDRRRKETRPYSSSSRQYMSDSRASHLDSDSEPYPLIALTEATIARLVDTKIDSTIPKKTPYVEISSETFPSIERTPDLIGKTLNENSGSKKSGQDIRTSQTGHQNFENQHLGEGLSKNKSQLHSILREKLPLPLECFSTNNVEMSNSIRIGLTDRMKLQLERFSGEPWVWHPFQPPQRALQTDFVRVTHTCERCSERLSFDLSDSLAAELEQYVDSSSRVSRQMAMDSVHTKLHINRVSESDDIGATTSTTTGSGAAIKFRHLPGRPSDPAVSVIQETQKSADKNQRYVLSVLGNFRLRYEVICVTPDMNDRDFMQDFRRKLRKQRGAIAHYLSPWGFGWNQFRKFRRINLRYLEKLDPGLPRGDYEYEYLACSESEGRVSQHLWQLYYYDHAACGRRCSLVEQLPKRKRRFELDMHARDEIMWGLDVKLQIWAIRVLCWQIVLLLGSSAFWVWWLRKHPGEWNAATSLFGVVTTIVQIFFWTPLSGIVSENSS